MPDEIKEGRPFPNALNRQIETMYVIHKKFDGQTMLINAETFDPSIHTRCNALGQQIDEIGRLVETKDKEAVNKAVEKEAPPKQAK